MQRNWIGRSTGCEIEFECETGDKIRVFTTRCDTVFGVTYVVLAPEHPLARKLATPEQAQAVEEYIDYAARASEIDRLSTTREKTGVFTGSYAVNPMNGKKVPVYLADYVLATYGTGAVMAVPAHDERDFAFATKYSLPIVKVIENPNGETVLPYTEDGIMINSLEFDGLMGEEAREAVAKHLSKLSKGGKKINYRLRDWLVSRQRYWGAPIPVIHCPFCGDVPVPEKDLPVRLPYDVEFRPDGKSPLAKHEKFMHTVCPKCGGEASIPSCARAGTISAMRTRTTTARPSTARQSTNCFPSILTSAARNTPACTFFMRASSRRRCAIWGISTLTSPSSGSSIRASSWAPTATA